MPVSGRRAPVRAADGRSEELQGASTKGAAGYSTRRRLVANVSRASPRGRDVDVCAAARVLAAMRTETPGVGRQDGARRGVWRQRRRVR